MWITLADCQDITRAGMQYVFSSIAGADCHLAEDKYEMIEQLRQNPDAIVVLDYTLFDINDVEELQILHDRFPEVRWLLFSVDLSLDFVKRVMAMGQGFSVLLKESPMHEIREAIDYAIHNRRYICQRTTEQLFAPEQQSTDEDEVKLTRTEIEILKDIALGMTTKEIAEKRYSSFHTINTHRKNIFRKIGVNNVHEATKYALRAGLVDSAEYYI